MVIGFPAFKDPHLYALSYDGRIALNGRAEGLEGRAEAVLAHEAVHLVIEKLFSGAPLSYAIKAQEMWDAFDLPAARRFYKANP